MIYCRWVKVRYLCRIIMGERVCLLHHDWVLFQPVSSKYSTSWDESETAGMMWGAFGFGGKIKTIILATLHF